MMLRSALYSQFFQSVYTQSFASDASGTIQGLGSSSHGKSSHKFSVQGFEYDENDEVMQNIRLTGQFTDSELGSKTGVHSIASSHTSGI